MAKALRLRQAAASSLQAALFEAADAVEWTRAVYGKPLNGVTAPEESAGAPMRRAGEQVSWCWETSRYEAAAEAAAIGEAASVARKEREQAAADVAAWEAKKAAMSKRERKKAEEKERKEAEAAAAAMEAAAAAAAAAAAEAEAAEAARLARPEVRQEMAYAAELNQCVRVVVEQCVEAFAARDGGAVRARRARRKGGRGGGGAGGGGGGRGGGG